jgi:ADP-ribosylglycohydrolase
VAPVGIRYASGRLEDIVKGAREASIPTHGGVLAIAAAAATAASVSAAIDGASAVEMFDLAQRAATLAEVQCAGSANSIFATALRTIRDDLHGWSEIQPAQIAARYFPQSPLTIVPLALVLGTLMQSAEAAILVAANVGGDSDSVASIVGAVLGARFPESVNDDWHAIVEQVNGHNLVSLGRDLSSLRC